MAVHGLNDALNDALMNRLRNNRCRAIRTHASCVGTLVAIVGSFVVLAWGQGSVGCPVHDHQHARLFTGQEGFEKNKTIRFDGGMNEGGGFLTIFRHHHAFSACQYISLHHPWRPCKAVQSGLDIGCSIKTLVSGCRNPCSLHRLLGMQF